VTGTPNDFSMPAMISAPALTSCGFQRGIFENVSTSAQGASSEMSSRIGSVVTAFNMVFPAICLLSPSVGSIARIGKPRAARLPCAAALEARGRTVLPFGT